MREGCWRAGWWPRRWAVQEGRTARHLRAGMHRVCSHVSWGVGSMRGVGGRPLPPPPRRGVWRSGCEPNIKMETRAGARHFPWLSQQESHSSGAQVPMLRGAQGPRAWMVPRPRRWPSLPRPRDWTGTRSRCIPFARRKTETRFLFGAPHCSYLAVWR